MPANGDQPAIDWANALEVHDRWLRTVVFARLGEPAAVDDVMQEIALAVVRQSTSPRAIEKLPAWLHGLAVKQSLLYRRTAGRQRKLINEFAERQYETEAPGDPLDWLMTRERRELIRAVVDELPADDAEVLLLKYTQSWSYRQIAEHIGASESAVESRLHRARRRMRERLAARTNDCES